MRILLDTHIVLWALFTPKKLKKDESEALINENNEVFVSNMTLWEISLKYSLGKLEFGHISPEDLPAFLRKTGFEIIPVDEKEASSYHQLPRLGHKDPFDRMLIWQAIHRNFHLMTHDKDYESYRKMGLKLFSAD